MMLENCLFTNSGPRLIRFAMINGQSINILYRQAESTLALILLLVIQINKDVVGRLEHAFVENLRFSENIH